MSRLEFAFLEAPTFPPTFIFPSSMEIYQATYRVYQDWNHFVRRYPQQIFHHLLHFISVLLAKLFLSPCLLLFASPIFHKHVEKALAYALALIPTFKGNASCMTKTLCSPDQSFTLFSANSISKCQNIFADVRFISAHAKLLPNIIP